MEPAIQKKIRCKALDAHPTEDAIIISYTIDAAAMDMEEKRDCKKIIRIRNLQETENLSALALEIVQRSGNLLSLTHADDLMSILSYLRRRQSVNTGDTGNGARIIDQLSNRPKTAASDRLDQYLKHKSQHEKKNQEKLEEPDGMFDHIITADFWKDHRILHPQTGNHNHPSLNDLSSFVDMLYEDYDRKMQAAIAVYRLCLVKENLSVIAENETLQLVLVRIVREEGRKYLDLATIVTTIFAIMSKYQTFHALIAKYKFGSQCLDLIQHEIRKEESAFQELSQQTRESSASSTASSGQKQQNSATNAFPASSSSSPPEYEQSFRKYQSMVRKQNHYLKAAFCLMFSLSEDGRVERKMLHRGILSMLVKSLEREAASDFFTIIIMFLTKLSVHLENKNQLMELNIIEKLYVILSSTISSSSVSLNITLIHWTLSLMYNLSFDLKLRTNMIQIGVLPKLLYLWSRDRLSPHAKTEKLMFQILYQMSRGVRVRGLFNFSFGLGQESMDMMMSKLMKSLDHHCSGHRQANIREMLALMINLSLCPKNSVKICSNVSHVTKLLAIAYDRQNSAQDTDIISVLVVKLLRNLTITAPEVNERSTKSAHSCIVDHAERICELIFETSILKKSLDEKIDDGRICVEQDDLIETFVTESIGLLSNLMSVDPVIDWRSLFEGYSIWSWCEKRLDTGNNCCEDDLILDVILLLGTAVSSDEPTAHYLSSDPRFMGTLISLMHAKQDDDEIMLQIIFIINCLMTHASTKELIVPDERISDYLIDLMQDKNQVIRDQCCSVLHQIANESHEMGCKIKLQKFKIHNNKWISMMMSQKDGIDHHMDEWEDQTHEEEDGEHYPKDMDEEDEDDFHLFLKPDILDSLEDSVTDSNLSTPVAWDMSDMMFSQQQDGSKSRASTARPHTGYKRR